MAKKKKKGSARKSMAAITKETVDSHVSGGGGGTKFNFPEGADIKFFKPKAGTKGKTNTMFLDIIPYEVSEGSHKGDLWWMRDYYVHSNIGAEDNAYICPLKTVGSKCPICEARAEIIRENGKDDDLAKDLRPRHRQIFNVIDNGDEDNGVQLWDMSHYLFGDLLDTELREDDDLLDFAALEGGMTLKVRFKSETFGGNTFPATSKIDFEERDDIDDDILDEVLDLDSILSILTYKQLEAIFLENDEEEEEDEEEEPPKRKRKSSKKVKEEEPEEEEEEKPKSKRRRKSKKVKEEEPEEDEEEEPEEKPKKNKRRSKKVKEEEPEEEDNDSDEENECPEGGVFGVDCDELSECYDCDSWAECDAARTELAKAKKNKKNRKK